MQVCDNGAVNLKSRLDYWRSLMGTKKPESVCFRAQIIFMMIEAEETPVMLTLFPHHGVTEAFCGSAIPC